MCAVLLVLCYVATQLDERWNLNRAFLALLRTEPQNCYRLIQQNLVDNKRSKLLLSYCFSKMKVVLSFFIVLYFGSFFMEISLRYSNAVIGLFNSLDSPLSSLLILTVLEKVYDPFCPLFLTLSSKMFGLPRVKYVYSTSNVYLLRS